MSRGFGTVGGLGAFAPVGFRGPPGSTLLGSLAGRGRETLLPKPTPPNPKPSDPKSLSTQDSQIHGCTKTFLKTKVRKPTPHRHTLSRSPGQIFKPSIPENRPEPNGAGGSLNRCTFGFVHFCRALDVGGRRIRDKRVRGSGH